MLAHVWEYAVLYYALGFVAFFGYYTLGQYPENPSRKAVTVAPFWPIVCAVWLVCAAHTWWDSVGGDLLEAMSHRRGE